MTIALVGFMGAGKTSVGAVLAEELDWPFVDLDAYIQHKTGYSPSELIRSGGEDFFRAVEADAVRDVVSKCRMTGEDCVLALGGGTPMTAPIRHLIFEESFCVYLEAGLDTLLMRISAEKTDRPMLETGDTSTLLSQRIPVYRGAALTINTEGLSVTEVARMIKTKISE